MLNTIPSPAEEPGAAIKRIRKSKGLTLADLSERTGILVSTLSKLENGKLSLSYDKLVTIGRGLEVDIAQLFGTSNRAPPATINGTGRCIVTRSGEGREIVTENYVHLYPAAHLLNKSFNPIVAELKAETPEEFGELVSHAGEEFTFVLEGVVLFLSAHYAPVRLKAGDSVFFDSSMGHAYLRGSKAKCRVLSICSATEEHLITSISGKPKLETRRKRAG